jgi:hypothetical protein
MYSPVLDLVACYFQKIIRAILLIEITRAEKNTTLDAKLIYSLHATSLYIQLIFNLL